MLKTKKILLAALVTICAVGSVLTVNENVSAETKVNCVADEGSGAQSCAAQLYSHYSSIRKSCTSNTGACKVKVDGIVTTCKNGKMGTECENIRNNFNTKVAELIVKFPCKSATGDAFSACCQSSGYNASQWKIVSDNGERPQNDSTDSSNSTVPPVELAPVEQAKNCTTVLNVQFCEDSDGILGIIQLVISIMTGAVVTIGAVSIVISGFTWLTARDDEQRVAKAKKRLLESVIGIIVWSLFSLLANLFIPRSVDQIKADVSIIDVRTEKMV